MSDLHNMSRKEKKWMYAKKTIDVQLQYRYMAEGNSRKNEKVAERFYRKPYDIHPRKKHVPL